MEATVREPIVEDNEYGPHIKAVVFAQKTTVECTLRFIYGPGSDYAVIYLGLPDDKEAVHAYDLFNSLFKPQAFKMTGITKLHRDKKRYINDRLEASWNIRKEQFKELLEEIKKKLGTEWHNAFSLVYPRIGAKK